LVVVRSRRNRAIAKDRYTRVWLDEGVSATAARRRATRGGDNCLTRDR
jgi:hypothetical protein